MQDPEEMTLEQMKALVESNRAVRFSIEGREALYSLLVRVLKKQRYTKLSREQRGIVRGFLAKVTGRSRAQITRLIGQWIEGRTIQAKPPARRQFPTRYTAEDAALLARLDAAHEELSGPAVKRILRREHEVFGHLEYQRLAGISVSHLYNLRRSKAYRKVRVRVEPTRASQVRIGERRKPEPLGKPGYFRIDTVHQGHQDGRPGLFHIDAVDTVTQWQVVGCVETISERHLLPVLEAMAAGVPVACSDIPPLREIARSTVHFFDPLNDREIQDALLLLASGKISTDAAERRAAQFTWEKTARATLDYLSKCSS